MSPLRFKLTTAVINHLLKTFTVFSLVVGLSGCNENLKDCNGFWDKTFGRDACSASTNALGSLPINTTQVMSTSPVDIAVIGETYSSPVGVVAMDPKNTFKSYKISRVSGTSSVPKIDKAGVLTWTPVDTEWGAHVFKVEVQGLEGEPQTHQFKIDVVKRKSQIDVLVGNEGGTFSDVEGRYLVEVKPESLADGSANIHLAVSELAYADGSFAVSPIVTGAKEGAINFLKAPESLAVVDTPISSVAKSINSRSVTKSDDSTFNWYLNINERNIREIDISSNAIRVNEYSSALCTRQFL